MSLLSRKRDKEILDRLDKAILEVSREVGLGRYPAWLGDLNYCYGYFFARLDLLGVLEEEKWNATQEKTSTLESKA